MGANRCDSDDAEYRRHPRLVPGGQGHPSTKSVYLVDMTREPNSSAAALLEAAKARYGHNWQKRPSSVEKGMAGFGPQQRAFTCSTAPCHRL